MRSVANSMRRLRGWSWPAQYPIAQFPNPPLIVALITLGLRYVVPVGAWADVFAAIGYVFLAIWAYLELTAGVNLFRRLLGAGGLAYVIVVIAQRFIG